MLRAALKAGIIMGIVAGVVEGIFIALDYVQIEPLIWRDRVAGLLCLLVLLLWFATGTLAVRFEAGTAPTTGAAARIGALAGAITQIMRRIAVVVTNLILLALGLVSVPFLPGSFQWLTRTALGPDEISHFAYGATGFPESPAVEPVSACIVCGAVGVAMAAGLSALGGILGRAITARRGS